MSSTVKVFHRKTKTGSVIKVVREHYLREDIHCGRDSCDDCRPFKQTADNSSFFPVTYLSDNPRHNISELCSSAHYIVPNVSVLQNQIDVITDEAFGADIILLQTVMDEIKKNIVIYSRIKELMFQKRFYVFLNEYNKQTFSERVFGESIPQYKQRLIRTACEWLQKHFQNKIQIILLLNHSDIKEETKIQCLSIDKYVKTLQTSINLIDKLADLSTTDDFNQNATFIYEDYLPLTTVQTGIKLGTHFQGNYKTSRENFLEGYVYITLKGEELMVLIQGRASINRAVNDDVVVIELFPKSKWLSKSGMILEAEEELDDDRNDDDKVIANVSHEKESDKRPTGKVVAIIKRSWRPYCGVLRERNPNINKSVVMNRYLFLPVERKIPPIRIETRQYDTLKSQKIIVSIDSWPRDSKYPKGHYVRSLGAIGDKETENEVLLLEHDVPYIEFTKSVLNCLPKEQENWKIPKEEYVNRVDLRNECVVSVDPPGCTDIDDALHCKDIGHGLYEIGVHIADVSNFVKDNTAMDKEAANRGTSVYLVDRRIDMIPTLLSSNLCSLRQDVERLTFSVVWTIDKNTAEIKSSKFVKSIIRSRGALTYAEAQLLIDSPHQTNEVAQSLRRLNSVAKILKRKRMENGALVLANAGELKFVEMESEMHENIVEIEAKQMRETNSMIEEFMLLANISVAEKIYEDFPELALLRRHPKPSAANFEDLVKAANARGFKIDVNTGKELSDSLNNAVIPNNEYFNLMLRMIATRCMTQALYFCSGAVSDREVTFKHFGLACGIYTHFTSPIRRYADLIVHRLLTHSIGYESIDSSLLHKNKIQAICDNINYRHRMAQYANRASVNLHTFLYIKSVGKPVRENGYLMNVSRNAVQIFIPRMAYELPYFLKPLENWKFDETDGSQTHINSNVTLKQFDSVIIELSIPEQNLQSFRSRVEIKLIQPSINESTETRKTKKIRT